MSTATKDEVSETSSLTNSIDVARPRRSRVWIFFMRSFRGSSLENRKSSSIIDNLLQKILLVVLDEFDKGWFIT